MNQSYAFYNDDVTIESKSSWDGGTLYLQKIKLWQLRPVLCYSLVDGAYKL